MNTQFRIRLALVGIFALLAAMVISETGFSQPPGFPGRPNIPQPPGMPNIPQPNFPGGPPQIPRPQIPEPQIPRPQIPQFENQWACSKCNHVIGTGIARPHVARCPNCGTRFDNTVEGMMEASRERMNQQVQNRPAFTKVEEPSKTKMHIIIGVLAILIFLVIVGCIVGIVIRSNSKPVRKRGSARKRPASRDEDDDEERPRRRSARHDLFEDDDDEQPRSRRKDADDETPDRTKKSSIRKNRYYNEDND